MAVIKFGVIVTDASGKIGGHYIGGSLSGRTLVTNPRQRKNAVFASQTTGATNPYNRATISASLIYVVKSWKNVSAANKIAWGLAAPNFPTVNKLGVPVKPSAYHCYVHINYGYYLQNGFTLAVPPANQIGVVPQVFTIATCSSSTVTITISPAVTTGYTAYIYSSRSISAGIKLGPTNMSLIATRTAGTSGLQSITSSYISKFGNPITGDTLWVGIRLQSNATAQLGEMYLIASVIS